MMDKGPEIDLENTEPDPILDRNKPEGNVSVPGHGKKLLSILIGLLVALIIIALVGAAIYLMRDSMPEVIQEYIPDDIKIPYLGS